MWKDASVMVKRTHLEHVYIEKQEESSAVKCKNAAFLMCIFVQHKIAVCQNVENAFFNIFFNAFSLF